MNKVVNNKITYLMISIITIFIAILVVIFGILPTIDRNIQVSAEGECVLTIKKVSTITVYVTGPGVEYIEEASDATKDVYDVDLNSEVRLRAVNESRIFDGWNISGTKGINYTIGNDANGIEYSLDSQMIKIFIKADTEISVERRDPVDDDFGTYRYNSFNIEEAADLVDLQDIINNGKVTSTSLTNSLVAKYDNILDSVEEYNNLSDSEKTNYILNNNNAIYDRIRGGYFTIANNLSLFGEKFTGIGNSIDTSFNGVFCGNNGEEGNSSIFASITDTEKTDLSYYGLFGYLGQHAVVRNLKLKITIGITDVANNKNGIIYAGGIAGYLDYAVTNNLTVTTNLSIEAHDSAIVAGGLAGYMLGGINNYNNINIECTDLSWTIKANTDRNIFAGVLAGASHNGFIRELDIDISGFSLVITNLQEHEGSTTSNIYAGNLYGYFGVSRYVLVKDVKIHGDRPQTIRCILDSGQVYVSGLFGYTNVGKDENNTEIGDLKLGKVSFVNRSDIETVFAARSLDKDSRTNLYAGGLFAYIESSEGTTIEVTDEFKNAITSKEVDGKNVYNYDYLFDGNFLITTIQNGACKNAEDGNPAYGSSIAGGLVGYGYIDFNDGQSKINDDRTELLISSENSNFKVEATQTQLTSSVNSNVIDTKDHCVSGLVYGLISKQTTIQNINVYANNANITSTREIGSTALGDVFAGGFAGNTNGVNFKNIKLYLNKGSINLRSLSYEVGTTNINNNAYCGGFLGYFTNGELINIEINGYDFEQEKEVGTTIKLNSIQNTKPGGGDYQGENYLGGLVGQIYQVSKIDTLRYIGSKTLDDKITMQGHENPDSAFCGGIIGFVKNNSNFTTDNINISNCLLKNATVVGFATDSDTGPQYGNPDIYLGGIVGASYCHGGGKPLTISNSHVYDSTIEANGNDRIRVYASGILGAVTWQNITYTIQDCYVYNTQITANSNSTDTKKTTMRESYAAGICAHVNSSTLSVKNSVVIDSIISANSNAYKATSLGIAYNYMNYYQGYNVYECTGKIIIDGCYVSSKIIASGINDLAIDGKLSNTLVITNRLDSATPNENGYVSSRSEGSLTNTFYVSDFASKIIDIPTDVTNASTNYGNYIKDDPYSTRITLTDLEVPSYAENENGVELVSGSNNYNGLYNKLVKFFPQLRINDEESFAIIPTIVSNNLDNQTNVMVTYHGKNTVANFDDATIWINAKATGETLSPIEHSTVEEAHDHGWFVIGKIRIYNNELDDTENVNAIEDIKTIYHYENLSYEYNNDKYLDVKYPYDEVSTEKSYFYEENQVETDYEDGIHIIKREYIVKLYKGMPTLELSFNVSIDIPLYEVLSWVEGDTTTHATFDNSAIGVGTYTKEYTQVEIDGKLFHHYKITYTPNIDLLNGGNNYTFYVGFNVGLINSEKHEISCFKVTLVPNVKTLVGITYPEYTKPLNYYQDLEGYDDNFGLMNDNNEVEIPYLLATNSITKFLPVVIFKNDPLQTYHSEDTYVDMAHYEITNNKHIIMSSGELLVDDTIDDNLYSLKLTLLDDENQTITIYYKVVDKFTTAVTTIGSTASYLPYATSANPFYVRLGLYDGYSSEPVKFITDITTDGIKKSYDFIDLLNNSITTNPIFKLDAIVKDGENQGTYDVAEVVRNYLSSINQTSLTTANYEEFTTLIDSYDSYNLYINTTGNINIDVEFVSTYTITFDLHTELFNPDYAGEKTKSYEIKAGTLFKDFFTEEIYAELKEFYDAATIYGYVFTGFYLVDDANTVKAYGQSFDDICSESSNITVSTSNVFYARWSFLIELVEAPGTHIQSSFTDSFMQYYENEEKLNQIIQIPINNNHGYVFTILKDAGFIGEASVSAYVINKVGQEDIVTNIEIEKYHDNMYLYFIPPEKITGYLVIVTSVSSSEIIVGEETASVTDEVVPEDGIYTFNYIVNHKNSPDNKSYIFDSGDSGINNLTMTKDFLLRFKEQSYTNGQTILIDRILPKDTVVEVYYQKIVNDVLTNYVVASYKVNNDTTSYIKLSDFTNVDQTTLNAFKQETFEQFLGNDESVSEVYYFVITPPNGLDTFEDGVIKNYVVEAGYLSSYRNPTDEDPFVSGYRTKKEFVNIPIEDNLDFTRYESSIQQTMYSVTPSRKTTIEVENDKYIFIDEKTYTIADMITVEAKIEHNTLFLYDDSSKNSIIYTSKELLFNINNLTVNLGYNTGLVEVYGKAALSDSWTLVETINVTDASYQDYDVKFNENYKFFKIDNISTKEIRCQKIEIVSDQNGMTYELEFNKTKLIDSNLDTDTKHYLFTNDIIGDTRHDGKTFMLAVQLEENGEIIENLNSNCITINYTINGITNQVTDIISDKPGKNTLYFDLSTVINQYSVSSFEFEIIINESSYTIHAIQLLESPNKYKPSSAEVRLTIE